MGDGDGDGDGQSEPVVVVDAGGRCRCTRENPRSASTPMRTCAGCSQRPQALSATVRALPVLRPAALRGTRAGVGGDRLRPGSHPRALPALPRRHPRAHQDARHGPGRGDDGRACPRAPPVRARHRPYGARRHFPTSSREPGRRALGGCKQGAVRRRDGCQLAWSRASLRTDCQMVLAMRAAPAGLRWIESYVRPGLSEAAFQFASARSSRRRSRARRRALT
jgi:hypothetical protein